MSDMIYKYSPLLPTPICWLLSLLEVQKSFIFVESNQTFMCSQFCVILKKDLSYSEITKTSISHVWCNYHFIFFMLKLLIQLEFTLVYKRFEVGIQLFFFHTCLPNCHHLLSNPHRFEMPATVPFNIKLSLFMFENAIR